MRIAARADFSRRHILHRYRQTGSGRRRFAQGRQSRLRPSARRAPDRIPDYNGNSMFNTLGNLTDNPHAGLLFIDFDTGRTLQLTGRASVDWNPERVRTFLGAERVIDFALEQIIDTPAGFPLVAKFRQFSRNNPKL
jgi:hypothetical protein